MQLSEAEWKVMKVLWRLRSASAREVVDALHGETGWAYTTVKTMLTRLAEKGAVREKAAGLAAIYAPATTQRAAQKAAFQSLVARAFDGMGAFVHHLLAHEKLDARQRDELRRLLDERDAAGAAAGDSASDAARAAAAKPPPPAPRRTKGAKR